MADVEITGADELAEALQTLAAKSQEAAARAMARVGLVAVREAKANAPISPTMALHSATLKRKKRTASRKAPGGLEKSIAWEAVGDTGFTGVSVFVAGNSYAGKYARRIHDEKGRSWHNRGAGTVAKGARADEKFIERALDDNSGDFKNILNDELQKVTV